ncbi:MAG: hypothetical protein ACI4LE_05010 [Faecalibacterium sp.]
MEKKMMMPANYNVMNDEEMTYTYGGAGLTFADAVSVSSGVIMLAGAVLSIGNLIWGVGVTRDWIGKNKKDTSVESLVNLAGKGVSDVANYASKSLWNAVVSVYTAINMTQWWPVTAIAWLTA